MTGHGLPGLFVSLEGGDAAGKSTQSALLVDWLVAEVGLDPEDVVATREPGGTPAGARIRELLLHGGALHPRTEALLFAADRAEHVETLIRPALAAGKVVLSDRYLDSSVAYQGTGRDLSAQEVRDLSLWATDSLLPDVTLLLDVEPAVAASRRAGQAPDRLEAESLAWHTRVREAFGVLAAAEPDRFVVVDTARDRAEVQQDLRAAVARRLRERGAGRAS
jgi:dTMP kinase